MNYNLYHVDVPPTVVGIFRAVHKGEVTNIFNTLILIINKIISIHKLTIDAILLSIKMTISKYVFSVFVAFTFSIALMMPTTVGKTSVYFYFRT